MSLLKLSQISLYSLRILAPPVLEYEVLVQWKHKKTAIFSQLTIELNKGVKFKSRHYLNYSKVFNDCHKNETVSIAMSNVNFEGKVSVVACSS